MKKMSDAEKIGNYEKIHNVNRLTLVDNQLHNIIFGNFSYDNRLLMCIFEKN